MRFLLYLRNIFKANRAFHIVLFRILSLFERWTKRSSLIFSIFAPMFLFIHRYTTINGWNLIHFIKSFIDFFSIILIMRLIHSSTVAMMLVVEISLCWRLNNFFSDMISVNLSSPFIELFKVSNLRLKGAPFRFINNSYLSFEFCLKGLGGFIIKRPILPFCFVLEVIRGLDGLCII